MSESERQKAHYEAIHDDYEAHYYDAPSMRFRERFIYDRLFKDVDLNGLRVADLACGSGFNSRALKDRFDASTVGFDISSRACEAYTRFASAPAHELDLTRGVLPDGTLEHSFDAAMIIGGLHHCVVDLPSTFRTVAKLIKPGGWFLMFEPNKRYVLEAARQFWYRFDRYFDADTEAALDHDEILAQAPDFEGVDCAHMGGPAYFLIYNSLIMRMPKMAKESVAPRLFDLERLYNKLPGRVPYPYFIARWKRQ